MKTSFKWATPPKEETYVPVETRQSDIVIIGAGHAGTCAARAAAEAGASVIVIEQQSDEKQWVLGVGEIGHINSAWQQARDVPQVDIDTFVDDWQRRTGNRSDYRLIRKYAQRCGECFDWLIEPLTQEERESIHSMLTPQSPHFPKTLNGLHAWSGTANMGVSLQNKMVKQSQRIAGERGAQFFFEMRANRLLKDGNRIVGVVATDKAGGTHQFLCRKGVVLAAGDYSRNKEMCEDLLTEAADLIAPDADWGGHGWDGSGIQMGIWAGGRLEPRSHAAMGGNYSFPGFDLIGSTAVLRVNRYGERYSNEGFGTHVLSATSGAKQPNGMLWGVFDSTIVTQTEYQAPCHAVFDYTEPKRVAALEKALLQAKEAGSAGIVTTENRPLFCADTIEQLSTCMFDDTQSREQFLLEVRRYNEICSAGIDKDFGKEAHLLYPIINPPFYACGQRKDSHKPGGQSLKLLVTVSGLLVNEHQQVLDEENEPLPGLFATGNCSGGRFGTSYTTSVPGQSISIAQTLGMVLGEWLGKSQSNQ